MFSPPLLRFLWVLLCLTSAGMAYGQTEECRVRLEDLKPVIAPFNPFFTDHEWKNSQKVETARLDEHRLLMITQSGCKRHHVTFLYIIRPAAIIPKDSFWVGEVQSLMRAVYFESDEYEPYRKEFESLFAEKIALHGVNEAFNFPIGTRNFVCSVRYEPEKGANIHIESVRYVFAEVIQRTEGIPREKDDGWYKQ